MTNKTRKQLGVLSVLVGLFVAVTFVIPRGEGPAGSLPVPSNQAGRASRVPATPEVADVNLEALIRESEALADPERNPFAFRQKPPPPPPRPLEPPEPIAPLVPTGPPPPPPIQLKFIGVLESPGAGGKVAILSDGRGNTFHAREGQDVDGRYRVLKISPESLELSYMDGRGRQTLRLSGQ